MSVNDPRLFDSDPLTGITEYFHYDDATDGFTIEYVQDVEPMLEVSKYLQNNAPMRWGEFSHVASIPKVIMMQLIKQGILSAGGTIEDEPRFRKWLNDRDNQFMRTRPGKV